MYIFLNIIVSIIIVVAVISMFPVSTRTFILAMESHEHRPYATW